MKKILLRVVIALVAFSLLGAGGYFGARYLFGPKPEPTEPEPEPIDYYSIPVDNKSVTLYWEPENLADLESDTDVIVKGYLLPSSRQYVEYTTDRKGNEKIKSGFTQSTLVVVETYKGTLQPGDKVPFVERYYTVTTETVVERTEKKETIRETVEELQLVTFNNYMPTPPETEHIFFISRQPVDANYFPGQYYLKTMEKGRYACLTEKQLKKGIDAFTGQDLGLNANTSPEFIEVYKGLYRDVITIYIDPPTEEEIAEMLAKEEKERAKEAERLAKEEAKANGKGGFPLIPVIAGAVAVVAVGGGAVVFMMLRKRKKAAAEADAENGDTEGDTEAKAEPPAKRGKKINLRLNLPFLKKKRVAWDRDDEPPAKRKRGLSLRLPFLKKKGAAEDTEDTARDLPPEESPPPPADTPEPEANSNTDSDAASDTPESE